MSVKLYFENSRGEGRVIADFGVAESGGCEEFMDAAMQKIKEFCDERNFRIYYTRMTRIGDDAHKMIMYDVGSHTEFFYLG